MDKSIAEIVKERREELKISQVDLAARVGTSQATIDKIENGRSRTSRFLPMVWEQLGLDMAQLNDAMRKAIFQPGAGTEEAIRRGLKRTVGPNDVGIDEIYEEQLPDGSMKVHLVQTKTYAPGKYRPQVGPANPILRDGLVGASDLPIYAAVRGGAIDDSVLVSPDPIDYVKRPEPLARARNGYGLYIVGDSMEPVFRQGDLALVHPNMPPKAGDEVVVCSEDVNGEHYAIIKLLTKVTATTWHLKQYNPGPGEPAEFTLDRQEWPICHLVVGTYRRR